MADLLSHLMPTFHRLMGRKAKPNGDDPKAQAKQQTPVPEQIQLDERELDELVMQLEKDWNSSYNNNRARMDRFRSYRSYAWRNDEGMSGGGAGQSNFHFPLIQTQIMERMAREYQTIFGEDAGVSAVPTRPQDTDKVAKVGAYMRWVVFKAMQRFVERWAVFDFHRLFYGRAHSKVTYRKFYFNHPTKGRVCYLESPDFQIIHPEDIYTPGEEFETVQDASFVFLRYWATPDQLLRDEKESGLYTGVDDDWDQIEQAAKTTSQRDTEGAEANVELKNIEDQQEGVRRRSHGFIEVREWYGKWRLPKKSSAKDDNRIASNTKGSSFGDTGNDSEREPATDSDDQHKHMSPSDRTKYDDDKEEREEFESDIVIRYFPKLRSEKRRGIYSIQRLDELYPDTPNKRPIFSEGLVKDGTYWSMGLCEMLLAIEKELTVNENLFTTAGQFSVGPLVFYRPASGMNPDVLRYEPNIAIPTDRPKEDVYVVELPFNPTFFIQNTQSKLSIAEKLTGHSDFSAGQQSRRPTAPKTARATMALLERGDLRVGLDTGFLLVAFGRLLKQIWELCAMFAPEEQFFRVTGEDAQGLFDVDREFAKMTAEEFGGEFDFELKPAIGPHSKEALKDDLLQYFSIVMQLPFVQTNPYAQYMLVKELGKHFRVDITKLLPMPQKPEISEDPREEWLHMLKDEPVTISPADDDAAHLERHNMDLMKMYGGPEESKDPEAMDRMIDHIQAHKEAQQQKQAAAAMTAMLMHGIAQSIQQNGNRFGEPPEKQKKGKKQKGGSPASGAGPQTVQQPGTAPGLAGGAGATPPNMGPGAMSGGIPS